MPGEFDRWVDESCGHKVTKDTRRAGRLVENSGLDYAIIRAAYMDDQPDRDYKLTEKGQQCRGTTVSRNSIADLINSILDDPAEHSHASLGISRPGTEGDRPVWAGSRHFVHTGNPIHGRPRNRISSMRPRRQQT